MQNKTKYIDKYNNKICYNDIMISKHKSYLSYMLIIYIRYENNKDVFYNFLTNTEIKDFNPDLFIYEIIGRNGLLFCPYCGGEAVLQEFSISSLMAPEIAVYCSNCNIYASGQTAVFKWNSRVKYDINNKEEFKNEK